MRDNLRLLRDKSFIKDLVLFSVGIFLILYLIISVFIIILKDEKNNYLGFFNKKPLKENTIIFNNNIFDYDNSTKIKFKNNTDIPIRNNNEDNYSSNFKNQNDLLSSNIEFENNIYYKPNKKEIQKTINFLRYVEDKKNALDRYGATINFNFIPSNFKHLFFEKNKYNHLTLTVFSKKFSNIINNLTIHLYENKSELRGKYKLGDIYIYNLEKTNIKEIISLFLHELGHYTDIKYLRKNNTLDFIEIFYNICWDDTYIMKKGTNKEDFVSGYAMTNKYEDFAESFIYYVLFNQDFYLKGYFSDKIKHKYDFFKNYVFTNSEFMHWTFRKNGEKIKNYYWDITKIDYSLEKFLNYLKK